MAYKSNGKPGFMLYHETRHLLEPMDPETLKTFILALYDYSENGVVPEFEGIIQGTWNYFQGYMNRDDKRYEKTKQERSKAGRLSHQAKKTAIEEDSFPEFPGRDRIQNPPIRPSFDTDTQREYENHVRHAMENNTTPASYQEFNEFWEDGDI